MIQEQLYKVLLAPHMTEKSSRVLGNGCYVFKVLPAANKTDIAAAVEQMFDVKVNKVTLCNQKGKAKVFKRMQGRRSGFKKAYVRLAEGQVIEAIGAA